LAIPENDGSAPDACGKHQRIPEFLQLQFADYSLILPWLMRFNDQTSSISAENSGHRQLARTGLDDINSKNYLTPSILRPAE
jgi:hypothetical protein